MLDSALSRHANEPWYIAQAALRFSLGTHLSPGQISSPAQGTRSVTDV